MWHLFIFSPTLKGYPELSIFFRFPSRPYAECYYGNLAAVKRGALLKNQFAVKWPAMSGPIQ